MPNIPMPELSIYFDVTIKDLVLELAWFHPAQKMLVSKDFANLIREDFPD